MMTPVSAPPIEIRAIGSDRTFRLSDYSGRPVLLLFVDYNTARSTRDVVVSLRRRYSDFDRLAIAVVVDLHIIPKPLRGTAKRIMETAYHGAADEIPAGFNPADHLILLPDWSGDILRAYGIDDVSHQIHMILISPNGTINTSYQGNDLSKKAIEFIEQLI